MLSGAFIGLHVTWCPPSLSLLLLAHGLALRGAAGFAISWMALGLVVGVLKADQPTDPSSDQPVLVGLDLSGGWRLDEQGWRVSAQVRWLRQGLTVSRWVRRVWLVVPAHLEPPRGSRFRVRGYLRRAPPAANGYRARAGSWILRVKSLRFIRPDEGSGCGPTRLMRVASASLRTRLEALLGRERDDDSLWPVRLSQVLILGRSDVLPAEVLRGLRAGGLAHIIALSGLHVGLLTAVLLVATSGLPTWLRVSAAIAGVGLYVGLAGARPSLVRASLMLMAVFGSWLAKRAPQPFNSLAWVAAGMVVVQPDLLEDLGFQLTVAATSGILVLAPLLDARWQGLPRVLRQALAVSVGATLGAMPWTLGTFHLFSPISPLLNLIAIPWVTLALASALAWLLCLAVVPPAAALPGALLAGLGRTLEIVGCMTPGMLGCWSLGGGWWAALLLAAGLSTLLVGGGWMRRGAVVIVSLSIMVAIPSTPADPEMVLIDVGQGESILLRDGDRTLLIDGGGWVKADIAQAILIPTLSSLGVRRLGAIVLTHPDLDHCGGLLALSSYLAIDELYTTAGWHGDDCATSLLTRAGIEAHPLWRRERLDVGRWRLEVLHPAPGTRLGRNDRSLVLSASVFGRRVLFTGDLEAGGEGQMLRTFDAESLGPVDVLKVGHHGSHTSTSVALLRRLRPRLALISCGAGNRYGHPAEQTLTRLSAAGTKVLRTDLHGAIRLRFSVEGGMHLELPGAPRR